VWLWRYPESEKTCGRRLYRSRIEYRPYSNIPKALTLLSKCARITGVSTFYETDPIGSPGSPVFVNGVVRIETRIRARKLKFNVLRWLEADLDAPAPRTSIRLEPSI